MAHTEKIISEETIFEGNVFTVKTRQVELENGSIQGREVVLHNGGAAILPIDSDNNVYLIRQYRVAFEGEVLEIPAGKLERGENPFEAAKRELSEETGFTAKNYHSLGEIWPTVGYCSEKIYIYLATDLVTGKNHPDDDEFVTTVKIPFSELYTMCMEGSIRDSKTLIAVLKAKELLGL